MVAAQGDETRDHDARKGGGVSGRLRLLGGSGEAPDTTPPPFGTAAWGYRRSEVDAWASWVAGLVAHGRNETIRADSAEATLRATLERLEQLERTPDAPGPHADAAPGAAGHGTRTAGRLRFDPPTDLPRRTARGATAAPGRTTAETPTAETPTAETPAAETPAAEPPSTSDAGAPDTTADARPPDHDMARLHVVETTLHEVLGLLHRLAERERTPT